MHLYPVFLNLEGHTCLVVGAGAVGMRKATSLLEAGARVRLVCLDQPTSELPRKLEWINAEYAVEHLAGVSLAFAAAEPSINRAVVEDAKQRGIWVNSASEPELGNAIVPAVCQKGRISLAVSTTGASPALATSIRDLLALQVEDSMVAWVELLARLREEIKSHLPVAHRSTVLRELANPRWLDVIRFEGVEAAETQMRAFVDRAASP